MTVVAIGPLTNIATLLRRHPEDRERIREIVIMGGSTDRGNHTPYAEFNVYADPEAAAEVLDSGVPTTWVGLNVSHQALVTADVLGRIEALGTPLARVCVELLTFFGSTYHETWGFPAPPLHDPITVAYLIDPTVMTYERVGLRIELDGKHPGRDRGRPAPPHGLGAQRERRDRPRPRPVLEPHDRRHRGARPGLLSVAAHGVRQALPRAGRDRTRWQHTAPRAPTPRPHSAPALRAPRAMHLTA